MAAGEVVPVTMLAAARLLLPVMILVTLGEEPVVALEIPGAATVMIMLLVLVAGRLVVPLLVLAEAGKKTSASFCLTRHNTTPCHHGVLEHQGRASFVKKACSWLLVLVFHFMTRLLRTWVVDTLRRF